MKSKTLKKKIRRLEIRLQEGPKKLAKLKRKLEAQLAADAAKARKKAAAKASPTNSQNKRPAAKPVTAKGTSAPQKVKKKLNLSPERRAQLSAAMKARWVAKRAAAAASPESTLPQPDFALGSGAGGS